MRIGIIFARMPQEMGGGHLFISGLLEEIRATRSQHEFFVFCRDPARHDPSNRVPTIDLASQYSNFGKTSSSIISKVSSKLSRALLHKGSLSRPQHDPGQSLLQRAIDDFDIDLVWNLGLTPHGDLQAPSILNVWDLQHRLQPYFPEVNLTGWTWQSREEFYKQHLRKAAMILTGTSVGRDEVIRFYGVSPKNVFVVPLPVPPIPEAAADSEAVRKQYHIDADYLLYPAQFWPHKNHLNALHALKILHDDRKVPLDLIFTGSDKGNQGFILDAVERLGLECHVHFLGFIPRSDLVALYREAFALLFPTFFGPDNLPPLEAFAIGCPVLASDVEGATEQLSDAAILFDPADPQSISDSIHRLWSEPLLRSDLIRKGKNRIRQRSQSDYVGAVCRILDDFGAIRRCWGRGYVHA